MIFSSIIYLDNDSLKIIKDKKYFIFKNRKQSIISTFIASIIYLGVFIILKVYSNRKRIKTEEIEEDDLVTTYKIKDKDKKKLLINDIQSDISE
jgi:hypothetical protein